MIKLKIALLTISVFIMAGCGKPPALILDSSIDLDRDALLENGCLNMEKLRRQLSGFSIGISIRKHSSDFKLESKAIDNSEVRRSLFTIAAVSHFSFMEKAPEDFTNELGVIKQTNCEFLEWGNDLEGYQLFKITTSKDNDLELQRLTQAQDGSLIGESYVMRIKIKNSRQLEIHSEQIIIDPCPPYSKAKSFLTQYIQWEQKEKMTNTLALISRDYLSEISQSMPQIAHNLTDLFENSPDKFLKAQPADLRLISVTPIDPEIHRCPYRIDPPSGEELIAD